MRSSYQNSRHRGPSTFWGLLPLTRAQRVLVAGAVAVALLLAVSWALQPGPDPVPLPRKLERQVQDHRVRSAVDSVALEALARGARHADSPRRRAVAEAARADRAAQQLRRRADSLAVLAAAVPTLRDSATRWEGAYHARTAEADSLRVAVMARDTALAAAERGILARDSALVRRAE